MSIATAHLIDSALLGDAFASPEMRGCFSDRRLVQRWLDTEVALAEAQAELGIIPRSAAAEIRAKAKAERFDLRALSEQIRATSHPLVPVVRALEHACDGDAGQYVHFGATTQDITDTGTVLLIRDALALLEPQLRRFRDRTLTLAREHRDTVMVGRTHGQHALPITLGFKFAVFAAELDRHEERLRDSRKRVLVGQLAGAVGSLASLGSVALDVQRETFRRLDLAVPVIGWHTSRDGLAEIIAILSMIAATVGKIANEVRLLQQTEIAELEEPNTLGKIGSSTMPHKRNPMVAENVVAIAKLTRPAMTLALDAMVQEHERDMGLWGVEWSVVPETFVYVAGALEHCQWILDGLRVDRVRIESNLHVLRGLMLSEAVMMRVSDAVGKQRAHEILYTTCMAAFERGASLYDALRTVPEIVDRIPDAELRRLLDPHQYIGSCTAFVDRVLSYPRHQPEDSQKGVHVA